MFNSLLFVLFVLNISQVYSGGFTYGNIESFFPKILLQDEVDQDLKIVIEKKIDLDVKGAIANKKLNVIIAACRPHILHNFNDDFVQKISNTWKKKGASGPILKQCKEQLIIPRIKKIKAAKGCSGFFMYTKEEDIQKATNKICRIKSKVVSRIKQKTTKVIDEIFQNIRTQIIKNDFKDLKEDLVAPRYFEYAMAYSHWFRKALEWMKKKDFDIRQITQTSKKLFKGHVTGQDKFEAELRLFYNTFPHVRDHRIREDVIILIANDIVEDRLTNFVVFDQLGWWKLPSTGYNFDSLQHKSDPKRLDHTAINNKLQRQKEWFLKQDSDKETQQRWEDELTHSICLAMAWKGQHVSGKDIGPSLQCKEGLKSYCKTVTPHKLANWATCSDLIAIKHYTDSDRICTLFRKTFYCDPKSDLLCRPHHFVAWKMQMERVFKKKTDDYNNDRKIKKHKTSKKQYWHGISNRCYDWNSGTKMKFTGPMSWTTVDTVAWQFACHDCSNAGDTSNGGAGMVLTATISNDNRYRPLDVAGISKQTEKEVLFFDGSVDLVNAEWSSKYERGSGRTDRADLYKMACDAKLKHKQPSFRFPLYDRSKKT